MKRFLAYLKVASPLFLAWLLAYAIHLTWEYWDVRVMLWWQPPFLMTFTALAIVAIICFMNSLNDL